MTRAHDFQQKLIALGGIARQVVGEEHRTSGGTAAHKNARNGLHDVSAAIKLLFVA
jgi:hypothetical protein